MRRFEANTTVKVAQLTAMAVAVTYFVACARPGQLGLNGSQLNNPQGSASQPASTQPGSAQGTSDSGGGNTFQGKPLESYIINIKKQEAFIEIVLPAIESMKGASEIYDAMNSLLLSKVWYLIPGDLTTLPAERIGSAVSTDQAALQDPKQVWINKKIFASMTKEDQGRLLLHELLLGLRLLKFDSPHNECLRWSEDNLTYCSGMGKIPRGKPSDLTTDDYAQVRASGTEILAKAREWYGREKEWHDLFYRYGYGNTFMEFSPLNAEKNVSASDMATIVSDANTVGLRLDFGYDFNDLMKAHPELKDSDFNPSIPVQWAPSYKCDVGLAMQGSNVRFQIKTDRGSDSGNFTVPTDGNILQDMNDLDGTRLTRLRLLPSLPNASYHKGQIYYEIDVDVDMKAIRTAAFQQSVCLDDGCNKTALKAGSKYYCSNRPSITVKHRGQ